MRLVIQNGARVWGGNEQWLALLSRGLLERGHEVVVSCVGGSAVEARLGGWGIPTVPVRPRSSADVRAGRRFRRWLRTRRPDALLLTSWRPLLWGVRAGRTAPVPRVAVRLGIVRPLPARGPRARELRRGVQLWIVNAPEIRDALLASAPGLAPDRIRVLLNGVPEPPASPPILRDELALRSHERLLVGAGHVSHRKGFDVALEALDRLRDRPVHLAVAGTIAEPAEAERLRARAAELGLAERFHLLGPRSDLPSVLRSADAFLLTSRNEGMANVMLEAMACGVPVVASDVSGVRTALGVGEGEPAGLVVPADAPGPLAEAVARTLDDPALRAELAGAARRRARDVFGVERMVAEAEAMLFG